MEIKNVKAGDRFKNYKELCLKLDMPERTSNSKTAQLRQLEQFVELETNGREFVIRKIYSAPIRRVDNRQVSKNTIYLDKMELIILDYLVKNKQSKGYNLVEMTALEIAILTGLCSNEYRDKSYEEISKKFPNITRKDDEQFRRRVRSQLTKIIELMMRDLQSRFILYVEKGHKIKERELNGIYSWRTANTEEETMIGDASKKAMRQMGFDVRDKFDRVIAQCRVKEFYILLNKIIKEDYDWDAIYKVYFLNFTDTIKSNTEQFKKRVLEISKEMGDTNLLFVKDIDEQAVKTFAENRDEYNRNIKNYFGELPADVMNKLNDNLLEEGYVHKQKTLSHELVKIKK